MELTVRLLNNNIYQHFLLIPDTSHTLFRNYKRIFSVSVPLLLSIFQAVYNLICVRGVVKKVSHNCKRLNKKATTDVGPTCKTFGFAEVGSLSCTH